MNVRYLFCEVKNNDHGPKLFANILKMLKPGGYVQWFEPLPMSARATSPPNPSIKPAASEQLAMRWRRPAIEGGSSYEWIENLPQIFQSQGLKIMALDRIPIPKSHRAIWNQSQLAELEEGIAELDAKDPDEAETRRGFVAQLSNEFDEGASVDVSFICVVGKRD